MTQRGKEEDALKYSPSYLILRSNYLDVRSLIAVDTYALILNDLAISQLGFILNNSESLFPIELAMCHFFFLAASNFFQMKTLTFQRKAESESTRVKGLAVKCCKIY